jgi:hypothetical protein
MEFFLINRHYQDILLFPGKNDSSYSIAKIPFIEDIRSFKKVTKIDGKIKILLGGKKKNNYNK